MDIKFKVISVSKNVVGLQVIPSEQKEDDLKASGSPDYGQCHLVITDEELLEAIEVGDTVPASFNF